LATAATLLVLLNLSSVGKVWVEEAQPTERPEVRVSAPTHGYSAPNSTTATKTDTPIIETPVSIQVDIKQVIADQRAHAPQDAVKAVHSVQHRGSGTWTRFSMIHALLIGAEYDHDDVDSPIAGGGSETRTAAAHRFSVAGPKG
jgi:outer membrane receptor protein involved in Fe transport